MITSEIYEIYENFQKEYFGKTCHVSN